MGREEQVYREANEEIQSTSLPDGTALSHEGNPLRAVAVLAFVAGVLVASIVFLCSCASSRPTQAPRLAYWGPDSAKVVVDSTAPVCAAWSVLEAMDILRPRADVTVFNGNVELPKSGEIVVAWVSPTGALANTTVYYKDGYVDRALVRIHDCKTRLTAHELGHAFGLINNAYPGYLMNGAYPDGGYLLTKSERASLDRGLPVP